MQSWRGIMRDVVKEITFSKHKLQPFTRTSDETHQTRKSQILFDHASKNRQRSVHANSFNWIQDPGTSFSRSKILEACGSGTILCDSPSDFTDETIHYPAVSWIFVRDDLTAEADGVFGRKYHLRVHPRCTNYIAIWASSVEAWNKYVTEISARCKQSMNPETAAQQDGSSNAERSEADLASATRSKVGKAPSKSA